MKQIIMNYQTGKIELAEVPVPICKDGGVLVRNIYSAISVGTERLMSNIAKSNLLKKAIDRPDLVRKVINMIKTEGLFEAYKQSMNRLDEPIPLGYSCVGQVVEVGENVRGIGKGEIVVCFGSSYASHAEYNWVPKNLAVKIPEEISLEQASFAGIGAIALHAIRLANCSFGERIGVVGLGLVGLLGLQILRAIGCKTLGVDLSEDKLLLAKELGCNMVINASDVVSMVRAAKDLSDGYGLDSVIVYASSGKKDSITTYAEMSRERGKIIITGVLEMEVPRKDFFDKELQLMVSRSAGPGIYDENFELKGIDYPIGYIRWTEQRNLQAFLELLKERKLNVDKLITHRFKFDEAEQAYNLILEGKEKVIGSLFEYPTEASTAISPEQRVVNNITIRIKEKKVVTLGLIGGGLFAKTTLLPILSRMNNVRLKWVSTTKGYTVDNIGKKFKFEKETTDYRNIIDDPEVDAVMILTRHNNHADLIVEALKAKKHIFTEKPLAINMDQFNMVIETHNKYPNQIIMVGFNRRFSPHSIFIKEGFKGKDGPFVVLCRCNAGYTERNSWVADPEIGGGRIIGEVCHFIDLIEYLTDEIPMSISTESIDEKDGYFKNDNVSLTFKLSNGSIATIVYYANGHKRFPREYVEISGNGMVGIINNFVSSVLVSGSKTRKKRTFGVDRGHIKEMDEFIKAVTTGQSPVSYKELYFTTLASIIGESLPTTKTHLY